MVNQRLFKSETYDNCNCAVNCDCQFNLPSTHSYCQSAFVGNIVEGHSNDTPVAGLASLLTRRRRAKRRGLVSLRDVTPMDPQELTRVR